jgi:hypothetical protein
MYESIPEPSYVKTSNDLTALLELWRPDDLIVRFGLYHLLSMNSIEGRPVRQVMKGTTTGMLVYGGPSDDRSSEGPSSDWLQKQGFTMKTDSRISSAIFYQGKVLPLFDLPSSDRIRKVLVDKLDRLMNAWGVLYYRKYGKLSIGGFQNPNLFQDLGEPDVYKYLQDLS